MDDFADIIVQAEIKLAEAADGYLVRCLTDLYAFLPYFLFFFFFGAFRLTNHRDFHSIYMSLSTAITCASQIDCLISLVQVCSVM